MQRRDLLKLLGSTTLGAAAFPQLVRAAALYPARKLDRVGIQLYTVRDQMKKDFEGTLTAIAGIGYKEVEFAGYFDHAPADVRKLLDKLKITSPSAHVGTLAGLEKDWDKTLDACKTIGHRYAVCAYLDAKDRTTLADYQRIADVFNKAAEQSKMVGIQFAYHNHDFEFTKIDGQIPYDVLLERCDPKLVQFEMDLYWITKAGQDPLKYWAKHPGRFPMVHVKDMVATPDHMMTDVGKGTIPWAKLFAKDKQAGVKHFFVENDEPKPDGLASAKVSFDYLSKLEF